jgi:hypothetical protein
MKDQKNDVKVVNDLAIQFCHETDPVRKSELGLKLVKCFHSLIMLYTSLVVTGSVPSLKTPAGQDASRFLVTLMSKNQPVNYVTLSATCRTLHLAFKQQTPDDIYDVMVTCFLRTCQKYDPDYHTRIKTVYDCLVKLGTLSFDVEIVNEQVGFDCKRVLDWLSRKEVLTVKVNQEDSVRSYKRGTKWKINKSFFESGPIGFVYFCQRWFKYYLNQHISDAMSQIESKEHILQLEHATCYSDDEEFSPIKDSAIQNIDGNYTDRNGVTRSADVSLMKHVTDVSIMNDAWVMGTEDNLFSDLKKSDRWLLKMLYVDELSWKEMAEALGCTVNAAKNRYRNVLETIRKKL